MIERKLAVLPPILTSCVLSLPTSPVESQYGTTQATPYSRNEEYFKPLLRMMEIDEKDIHDCRVITLEAGKEIKTHTDKKHGNCIHLVLRTNDKCENTWGNETYHMKQGYIYEVNQGEPHSAVNAGETDRSHLMVILRSKE